MHLHLTRHAARTPVRRLVVALVAALAALVTAGALTPADAAPSAPAAPAAVAEFQCGPNNWIGYLVPDNPPGAADFGPACWNHDACYSAGSTTDRATCDARFRADMRYACDLDGGSSFCYSVASLYYQAVRSFGDSFYEGSGLNN